MIKLFSYKINRLNFYVDEFNVQNTGLDVFNRTLLWTKYRTQGRKWLNVQKTLNSKSEWRVVFEGVSGRTTASDIAIDDAKLLPGKCPPSKFCDFETGDSCEFQNVNDNSANLRWEVGKSSDLAIDHTTSTTIGQYAYVKAKDSTVNSKARLESAVYAPNGAECLQFWYTFEATTQSAARINVYEKVGTNYGSPKWSKNSEVRDSAWMYGQVEIGTSASSDFSVVFEAIKLTSNVNDNLVIGLDDINIRIGQCKPPINCDFEELNLCSWTQSDANDFDWLINQGQTDSFDTGPHVDVTLGNDEGAYIYVESSSPAKAGDKSIITSEYLSPTTSGSSFCFGLWYFMFGRDVGDLSVWINDTVTGSRMIRNISGEQGFNWQPLFINISNANDFRISVQGVVSRRFSLL